MVKTLDALVGNCTLFPASVLASSQPLVIPVTGVELPLMTSGVSNHILRTRQTLTEINNEIRKQNNSW